MIIRIGSLTAIVAFRTWRSSNGVVVFVVVNVAAPDIVLVGSPITGTAQVDETIFGGHGEGVRGRKNKKLVAAGIEKRKRGHIDFTPVRYPMQVPLP